MQGCVIQGGKAPARILLKLKTGWHTTAKEAPLLCFVDDVTCSTPAETVHCWKYAAFDQRQGLGNDNKVTPRLKLRCALRDQLVFIQMAQYRLRVADEHLLITFYSGEELLPLDQAAASATLSHMTADLQIDREIEVSFPEGLLEVWLEKRQMTTEEYRSLSINDIVQYMKVCCRLWVVVRLSSTSVSRNETMLQGLGPAVTELSHA